MPAGRTGPFVIVEAITLLERTEKLKGRRQRTHHLLHELRIRRAVLIVSIHLGDNTVTLILVSDVGLRPQELTVPRLQEVAQILTVSIGTRFFMKATIDNTSRESPRNRKQNRCPSQKPQRSPSLSIPPRPSL